MDEGHSHEVVYHAFVVYGQVSLGQEEDEVAVGRSLLVDFGVTRDAAASGRSAAVTLLHTENTILVIPFKFLVLKCNFSFEYTLDADVKEKDVILVSLVPATN